MAHSHSSNAIPGAAIRGTALGVIFMAVFGTIWSYTGIMGMQNFGTPLLLIPAVLIGGLLVIGGIALVRASRRLPVQAMTEEDPRRSKAVGRKFLLIFAAEGAAIGIAAAVCGALSYADLIPVVVAIIVGAHFFPLASLFKVRLYHVTGALLCLLALATWLFAPAEITFGGHSLPAYMAVVGCGSAVILWSTALAIWLMGRRLLAASGMRQ